MKLITRLNDPWQYFLTAALVLMSVLPSPASAQASHSHISTGEKQLTTEQKTARSALLKTVRDSTERFKDVAQAEAEGYSLMFGCVSGDSAGAMGLHYVNGGLLKAGIIDPTRPPIVIYEPTKDGQLKLIGADFLVFVDQWNKDPEHTAPPELMGQLFHLFDAPNRFGLPAFTRCTFGHGRTTPTARL